MKNISLTLILSIVFASSGISKEAKVRELAPAVTLKQSKKDNTLKQHECVYKFYIEGIEDQNEERQIDYSVDGKNYQAKLVKNKYFTVKTSPGNHVFQFYYNIDHNEVSSGELYIRAQHRDEYNVRFERVDIPIMVEKPVIYLYPEKEIDVEVKVNSKSPLFFTYPTYNNGWNATVTPEGEIKLGHQSFRYLFWEANQKSRPDLDESTGYVIERTRIVSFLENSLSSFGFNGTETADFITYWGPRMIQHQACKIHFLMNEDCNQFAELGIEPTPDNIYRFYMIWSPIDNINDFDYLSPQQIPTINRQGFSVLEWGGIELPSLPDRNAEL